MKIAIIGLGYVGLPLSIQFANSGVHVIGLDLNAAKVQLLNSGRSYLNHISAAEFASAVKQKSFEASTDFARIREVEAIIICVPTPLNAHREPDLSYVLATARSIAPHLQRGVLVVLESTTYPGTTDGEFRGVLEKESGMVAGEDFLLAYSPEREDPGNRENPLFEIPKIVGGYTPACLERAQTLYQRAVRNVVSVSSCRIAEAAKLLENTFRSVNIALVNELKMVYHAMGLDIWEVIEAARTKPFGFTPFFPGPGLGGHCLPIDPFYLAWKAREFGQDTRFIELAGKINTAMPDYVVSRVVEALNDRQQAVKGSSILVVGLAYKPNVNDDRESSSYALMNKLMARGAMVAYYDPHIPEVPRTRDHSHWAGVKSIPWTNEAVGSQDLAIIATDHAAINYAELAAWCGCIVDTRNAMSGISTVPGQVWKA